jgi:hypothetical protein
MEYRCDIRDQQGRVFSTHEIETRNDDDAAARCRELCPHSAFDLWRGEVLVRKNQGARVASHL